jgi:Methyltransferase domain
MPGSNGERERRGGQRRSAFYATCPSGLARILRDQLALLPGVELTGRGSDGHTDYVLFDADAGGRALALRSRLADGVFAEAGQAARAGITDPYVLAGRCWRPEPVQRALSVWAEQVRPLAAAMSYQVVTQVHSGPRSLRAGLRDALIELIGSGRPRWRHAADGQLEICIAEWRNGEFVTGLRLGGNRVAQAAGPETLASAVAAALVYLAGDPGGMLLDPCCGRGEILAQAVASGWTAEGSDPDPAQLAAAQRAVPGAVAREGDAAGILEADGSVEACVTRLPVTRAADPDWLGAALAEMSRVTRSGGMVIVLAPDFPRSAIPAALRLRRQVPVRLAAGRQYAWVFRRA